MCYMYKRKDSMCAIELHKTLTETNKIWPVPLIDIRSDFILARLCYNSLDDTSSPNLFLNVNHIFA